MFGLGRVRSNRLFCHSVGRLSDPKVLVLVVHKRTQEIGLVSPTPTPFSYTCEYGTERNCYEIRVIGGHAYLILQVIVVLLSIPYRSQGRGSVASDTRVNVTM
jgi:hypothetical protein